jgi:hypothetical protein
VFKQWFTAVAIGAVLLGFAAIQVQTPPLVSCDRTCMTGMVDRYLAMGVSLPYGTKSGWE